MPKTKLDIKNELKDSVSNCKTFEQMIDAIATYIVKNYKLKKVTITTTLEDEELTPNNNGD